MTPPEPTDDDLYAELVDMYTCDRTGWACVLAAIGRQCEDGCDQARQEIQNERIDSQ